MLAARGVPRMRPFWTQTCARWLGRQRITALQVVLLDDGHERKIGQSIPSSMIARNVHDHRLPNARRVHRPRLTDEHAGGQRFHARLAPLRDRGVFILGSGNAVHNLRRIEWSDGNRGFDWSERFDEHVHSVMTSAPAALADVEKHPDYPLAVRTTEHFLPLAYVAGLCTAAGEAAQPFAEGRTLGSLSMTSYILGMQPPAAGARPDDAQSMPAHVPPEQTNI